MIEDYKILDFITTKLQNFSIFIIKIGVNSLFVNDIKIIVLNKSKII